MPSHPPAIQRLIDRFTSLPGIGEKTAEKLVYFLLRQPAAEVEIFSTVLRELPDQIRSCTGCGNYAEADPCWICRNPKRNHALICVVAKPQDLQAIESTGDYAGVYHVLGGTLDPIEGVKESDLRIQPLLQRIRPGAVHEIILALSPDINGETTILALKHLLDPLVSQGKVKVTRLARGLPMGSDLEYADQVTLSNALSGRREA